MSSLKSIISAIIKYLQNTFTTLNCGYIDTVTFFPNTNLDIQLKPCLSLIFYLLNPSRPNPGQSEKIK